MNLAIVKYNAGNIQSVLFSLDRIGISATVTDDQEQIKKADKVIFPGVGEAGSAIRYLEERGLDKVIKNLEQPVLGICLGMQLLCTDSEENDTVCLGVFKEKVKKFIPPLALEKDTVFKVPQIGWNQVSNLQSAIFKGIEEKSYCYFVHSYYVSLGEHTIATTDYIQPYSSALNKNNFYGVQFHPEKSADAGEQILRNFLNI